MKNWRMRKLPIKEKRHPEGMIDLSIVPMSMVAGAPIKKMCGIHKNHHVLIVDLGEME
jgi:hypothetical protein